MTLGFSSRRTFNHRRHFYARAAPDPQQAPDLCIGYRVSTGVWGEAPGMCEQLAQQGWVGTEIMTGNDARYIVVSSAFDEISPFGVLPSTVSRNVKRVRQENMPILITSRSYSVAGHPANELWCCEARILHDERWGTDALIDMPFRELAGDLQYQGLFSEAPRFFHGGNLPKDHLFTRENVLSMRKAVKKEPRRRC